MEKAAMPLFIEITFENGSTETHNFPVEIWEQGRSYSFFTDSDGSVSKVIIDPKNIFPDVNIANNSWKINSPNAKPKSRKQ